MPTQRLEAPQALAELLALEDAPGTARRGTRRREQAALRVLLAEHHGPVRRFIREALLSVPEVLYVAEVSSGAEALELASGVPFEILVTDLRLPGVSGLELTRCFAACSPPTRTLVISLSADPLTVSACFEAGAWGVVSKRSLAEELEAAVRSVACGRVYLSSSCGPSGHC